MNSGRHWLKTFNAEGVAYSLFLLENNIQGGSLSAQVDSLIVSRNVGFITENYGKTTFSEGAAFAKVYHGLAAAPSQVLVTLASDPKGRSFWISSIDSDGDGLKRHKYRIIEPADRRGKIRRFPIPRIKLNILNSNGALRWQIKNDEVAIYC